MFGKTFTQVSQSYLQFSTMHEAGLSLSQILDYFRGLPRIEDRAKVHAIETGLKRGRTLSQACQSAGLSPFDVQMLKAGEDTGKLQKFIKILVDYYLYRAEVIAAVKQALVEPGITLLLSLVIMPLPGLFDGSLTLQRYLFDVFAVIIFFGIFVNVSNWAYVLSLRSKELSRLRFRIFSVIPFASTVTRMMILETFTFCIQAYLEAGFGINEAMEAAAQVTDDENLEVLLRTLARGTKPMQTLSAALASLSRYSDEHVRMIKSGELSGTVDRSLLVICKQCREECQRSLNRFKIVFQKLCKSLVTLYIAYKIISDFMKAMSVVDKIT